MLPTAAAPNMNLISNRKVEFSRYGKDYYCFTVGRDIFEIHQRYRNLKVVGGGAYGTVCSAEDAILGKRVAIKKIKDVFSDLVDAKRILREIKLLRHLGKHDNIISILNIMTMPPGTTDFKDIYIVTDLMESDLERIISSTQPLTDAHFQYFLYQILRGIKYIHSAQVLHRDLKTSNLLVNSNCDLAICDFGLARGVQDNFNEGLTEYVVTRWYRAPELLTECQNYGSPVDIWAIGCILAEMLRREAFFQGKDPAHQLYMIIRVLGSPTEREMAFVTHEAARRAILQKGFYNKQPFKDIFVDANPQAIDLLEKMLAFNPDDRITVNEALEHPYLAALHSVEDEPEAPEPFNFDFEREYLQKGLDIPKAELQRLMYAEMESLCIEEMRELQQMQQTQQMQRMEADG